MSCEASGSPQPDIHWYRRGELIDGSTDGVTIDGNRLVLDAVKGDEHGAYLCKATNPAGRKFETFFSNLTF